MDSAIPLHLRTPRTRHKRVPDDYTPPYPSFVARHKPQVVRVVMAFFGVQYRGAAPALATEALAWIAKRFGAADGPTQLAGCMSAGCRPGGGSLSNALICSAGAIRHETSLVGAATPLSPSAA